MTTPPEVVNEADKPFILVLILLLGVLLIGGFSVVTGKWNDAKDFVAILTGFLGMGIAFYFKGKV